MKDPVVEIGQVWETRDGRRQVHVVTVHPDGSVVIRGQRTTTVRPSTLARGYRLHRHPDGTLAR